MDVARISAVSPKQIDWRRLTAKEIVKYEQQGVEVPTQYIQWAKEFLASLETNDDVTYEKASSTSPATSQTSTPESSTPETSSQTAVGVEDTSVNEDSSTSETDTPQTEEEKTAAQQKRQELQENGTSLRKQAIIFTGDSKENQKSVLESAALISAVETASVNEIESLENYMNDLLSKAEETQNELKGEVAKLNDDKSDKTTFSKINQLQKQLEKYGTQGQSQISGTEGDLTGFEAVINEQSPVMSNALDFGNETINVGTELIASAQRYWIWAIIDRIIGKAAVNAGEGAVGAAEATNQLQVQALSVNTSNLSAASSFKQEVQAKTGVEGNPSPKDSNDENSGDEEIKPSTEEKDGKNDDKTAVNDGSDTTAQSLTNIDEILKRKIRKGENIEPPPTA